MCGRIRQARSLADYQEHLRWNPHTAIDLPEALKYNVPPGTRPIVMHRLGNGAQQVDRLFWGYKPPWYTRGPASNARLDTVLRGSSFWKPLLASRVIVPADGWYEWTGPAGHRQPWYISPRDSAPLLMAGITAWRPGRNVLAETGFAVITDDAAGGMVDLHDRRPVCLALEDALAWVDPQISVEQALELLSTPRPESAFHWWQVTPAMGNSRYQLPTASDPIMPQPALRAHTGDLSMEDRMYLMLKQLLGDQHEAMVPVDALYDIAGEEWLPAANAAAAKLNASVERPEQSSSFATIIRR